MKELSNFDLYGGSNKTQIQTPFEQKHSMIQSLKNKSYPTTNKFRSITICSVQC
jgi:Icc-related predicted phosphoesterase